MATVRETPTSEKSAREPAHRGAHRRKRSIRRRLSMPTRRALRGVLIVVAAFVALGVATVVTQQSLPRAAVGEERLSEALVQALRDGEAAPTGEAPLPAWFSEEFFNPDGFFDQRCNENATVMSLSSADPARKSLARITVEMEARGWTAIASGQPSMTTMIRKEGMHTWALIDCEDIGGQSTIVLQTLPEP